MTEQKPIGYAPWHPKHGWRLNLADKDNHTATCNAMRAIESAGSQGWLIKPIYDAAPVADDKGITKQQFTRIALTAFKEHELRVIAENLLALTKGKTNG